MQGGVGLEKKRYIEYDIMRIIACFGVIMIHAGIFDQSELYDRASWEYQWITIWGVLSRWAVPAFVMLSGMMILPKADNESIFRTLTHRVIRMLTIYIIWSAVYSAYNVYVLGNIYAPTKFKTFIDGCFSGELHMWYIPMIAGLYLIAPILAILVKKLEKQWTWYWLFFMFLFSSVIPFLIKLDIKFISTVVSSISGYAQLKFLGGWTLYFVLGYYIRQYTFNAKQKVCIYVLAILSLVFTMERTVLYCMKTGEAYGVQNYEFPNIYMMGIGVMVCFKEEISKLKFTNSMKKFIESISKLTFGIYLSHVLLLRIFYALDINLQFTRTAISVPVVAFLVFTSGAALTWIIQKIPVIGKYIT